MKVPIETTVDAPMNVVWDAWVTPEDITQWNFASEEWCCPKAQINLEVGGSFNYRMEAKDGSMGFDFEGEFASVLPYETIVYKLADEREVQVQFIEGEGGIKVLETFDAEDENSAEQQRQGWLCILENFKQHVESKSR